MATSVRSPSQGLSPRLKMSSCSPPPPLFSPNSDKQFWRTLRSRVETHIENRNLDLIFPTQMKSKAEGVDGKCKLKEDSMLLLRGFDSVANSLSQLSNNLESALQGARDLSRGPTLTDIVHATLENAKSEANTIPKKKNENEEEKRGSKRKLNSQECSEEQAEEDFEKVKEVGKMKKAKNLAISMATKAAALARDLKSIRSDLSFMQERCALLEDENKKLRDGLAEAITPDEDDLVRLQLEALLAEKSRLANENTNLKRENQCLNQLLEYHQLNSQDLSASYENLIKGMGLDFSSPSKSADGILLRTPDADMSGFCKSLDEYYGEE